MPRSHAPLAIASGPPPEVLLEIGEAWERAQAADDLELHFESEPALGRAWGALCADGRVIERISAAHTVAIACGDADLWPSPPVIV
jgi:hypothetical protein